MRLALLAVILATILATAAAPPSLARIQPDVVCVDPDIEFPVACDDED